MLAFSLFFKCLSPNFAPMKSIFYTILLFLFAASPLSAQHYVDKFFANIPPQVLSIIDQTSRLDMIDLYNNNMQAQAENLYGGMSRIQKKSDYFIDVKLTESSTWQMRIMPSAHDTLIVCVHSLTANGTSSTLRFYKQDWHPVKHDLMMPTFSHFLTSKPHLSAARIQTLESDLKLLPVKITLDEKQPLVIFELSTEALTITDKADAKLMLKPLIFDLLTNKFVEKAEKKDVVNNHNR